MEERASRDRARGQELQSQYQAYVSKCREATGETDQLRHLQEYVKQLEEVCDVRSHALVQSDTAHRTLVTEHEREALAARARVQSLEEQTQTLQAAIRNAGEEARAQVAASNRKWEETTRQLEADRRFCVE